MGGIIGGNIDDTVPSEFWTFSPDGTDRRKEFTDKADEYLFRNFGFAWHPMENLLPGCVISERKVVIRKFSRTILKQVKKNKLHLPNPILKLYAGHIKM